MKPLSSLAHGSADPERGFSVNKGLFTSDRSLLSEVKVRSNNTKGRNLLAKVFSVYNWHEMESLGSVDQ